MSSSNLQTIPHRLGRRTWPIVLAALSCVPNGGAGTPPDESVQARRRAAMVAQQLKGAGITDPRVLEVMGRLRRHKFVPPEQEPFAYEDGPLPIGFGQTISQSYIVALMTRLARPR